ncbi:hypothetical protein KDK_79830 [Dictyobacter kobayashii]|uniref:Uncharacterized protein n=1 Tax=Dictyobacter kobayashii TaxID=2014872 RepID=A0A402AYP5_9CHLR|nr:hypothetical protein KDK_79830 [Dictyobacter kobayashii]
MSERFQAHYQQRQIAVPEYAQRLLCYQCYIALSALRFYAFSADEPAYQWLRRVIESKRLAGGG